MDYIDYGIKDGHTAHALFELPDRINYQGVVGASFQMSENCIIAIGQKPISDVMIEANIPAGTKISSFGGRNFY